MPSQPVRILLVDMPRLVRDMVENAARSDPGVEVVGVLRDADAIGAASAGDAEVIVVGVEQRELPAGCRALLDERAAGLRLLGIEAGDGGAYLYELRPRRSPLGELSPAEVVDAIKELAR
jgi:DNA-binding NarL/FixJ family response regulator